MTSRRNFLRAGVLGAAHFAVSCGDGEPASKPPNILLIIGDDLAWYDIGCYGSQNARTPNVDRLASEGMRFTRSFTATAMCSPMRQQMYTGLFPVRNGAYPNHSQTKPGTQSIPHYLKPLGYRVGQTGKRHFGPLENYPFEYIGEQRGIDFDAVKEFVNRDPQQPYCLIVCSNEPHAPYTMGEATKYDPASLELPPYFVDTPTTRETYGRYLAEAEYLDGEVGRCMEIVEHSGQAENTMFIFCSEQGSGFPGGKWTCYDAGLRQGWIVRWPARVQPGSTTDAMVEGVDVLPTLIEAGGGDPASADFDGSSYLAVLEGRSDTHNEFVYGCHTTRGIITGSLCFPVRSIRGERYKLILNLNASTKFQNVVTEQDRQGYWNEWVEKAKTDPAAAKLVERYQHRPEVEFYDVIADPYELSNLAEDPQHAATIADMRERLEAWMKQQGDKGNETELAVKPHPTQVEGA